MNRFALIVLFTVAVGFAVAADSPRERVSINDNWRFIKGDPNGDSSGLLYDVRAKVKDKKDDKAADAETTEAEKIATTNRTVLKPWILPTGNVFIKDPTKRHTRPDGNPGGTVSYVQRDFDDSSWRSVNLPHDWAIEGPFDTTGKNVGGGMGRLPSPGIGWYRKKLDIPANDAGKSIFLEIDGAMSYAMVWLNGHLVGGWPYGYASWRVDLTPFVAMLRASLGQREFGRAAMAAKPHRLRCNFSLRLAELLCVPNVQPDCWRRNFVCRIIGNFRARLRHP